MKKTFTQAYLLRLTNPGYSHCGRCKYPWSHVKSKTIFVNDTDGVFATCEDCWSLSTLDELKEYYREVYLGWKKEGIRQEDIGFSLEEMLTKVEESKSSL